MYISRVSRTMFQTDAEVHSDVWERREEGERGSERRGDTLIGSAFRPRGIREMRNDNKWAKVSDERRNKIVEWTRDAASRTAGREAASQLLCKMPNKHQACRRLEPELTTRSPSSPLIG